MGVVRAVAIGLVAATGITQAGGEPATITLSCDGKITDARASEPKPEPITKMGVVVNLTEKTVAGFGGIVARIDKADEVYISFSGQGQLTSNVGGNSRAIGGISVMGDLDRVTGALSVTTMTTATIFSYELYCKPATRLF